MVGGGRKERGLGLSDMNTHFWSLFRNLRFRVLVLGLFLYQDYLEGGLLRQKAGLQPQFLFDAIFWGVAPHFAFCMWCVHLGACSCGGQRAGGSFFIAFHLLF